MHFNANKSTKFIVVADYADDTTKTAAFASDATIKEIFDTFWPEDGNLAASVGRFELPTRLRISPDEKVVPPDERFKNLGEWLNPSKDKTEQPA
ncbi:hypothetical protein [Mesorhizobium sp. WSM4312]|uniref:hypothetical protein n=1 Tax=Mesorhizobium sp. WSM4312 TaxID=2029411 RepID=UPI00117E184A|nr:hypothetical protein [Mesorhizobium sp. WSM4312]